jgi:LPS sulfotransferase NodH
VPAAGSAGPLQRILDDIPRRAAPRPPRVPEREFVILFTARTGSSHLAELLTSARIGDVREWLHPQFLKGQAEFFGVGSFAEYFARIRANCPNGVFGHKMTIWFYEAFSREVRLEDHFDFGTCVFLYREDLVAQAVSLFLANRRKIFHDAGEARVALSAVDYDPTDIMKGVESLAQEEQRLRGFVDQHAASPRFVSYEQFIRAELAEVVDAVARFVGVTAVPAQMRSRHRKLDDPQNPDFADRFRRENAAYCEQVQAARRWLIEAAAASPLMPA